MQKSIYLQVVVEMQLYMTGVINVIYCNAESSLYMIYSVITPRGQGLTYWIQWKNILIFVQTSCIVRNVIIWGKKHYCVMQIQTLARDLSPKRGVKINVYIDCNVREWRIS